MSLATPTGSCATSGADAVPAIRQRPVASWPEAYDAAYLLAGPLPPTQRPLTQSGGLVLSAPVRALSRLPPHDSAAMDGWVVSGPPPWVVVGRTLAGDPAVAPLEDGTALEIATGAVVPIGAWSVLRREDGAVRSGLLHQAAGGPLPDGHHIRFAGEEARRGEVLLPAGTRLTPPALGLTAAAGYDTVAVHRPAVVQPIVLGDELRDAGPPGDGRVRDALGPQLPGWLGALGAVGLPPVRLADRLDLLVDALSAPSRLADAPGGPDVVVTTGGSSQGSVDHVRDAVREVGGRMLVDGVDVRPGHPMALALLPCRTWLVVLPGNPLAACAALLTLVQPLLHRLQGLPAPRTGWARLAVDVSGPPTGHQLIPARRTCDSVEPLRHCGSGMLRGLALADTVLVLPPGDAVAGTGVQVLPLPWCPQPLTVPPAGHDDERTPS